MIAIRRITVAGVRRRLVRARWAAAARLSAQTDRVLRRRGRLAVDYAGWLERRTGRKTAEFPDAWRVRADLQIAEPSRVAVLVHVFYPELVAEIVEQLAAIPVPFDLVVTNASPQPVQISPDDVVELRHVLIVDVENHGRDIWPMVQVVNAGLLDPYDVVLKVHTKRSEWRADHELAGSGDEWRVQLLNAVLGDSTNVAAILSAFAGSPTLGLVTASGCIHGADFWGADLAATQELLRRLELAVVPGELNFAGGSIYWIRGFLLQGLRALALTAEDFEPERGHIDGTTAHAIERAIGILTEEAGLQIVASDNLPDNAIANSDSRYRPGTPRELRARVVPFYLPQFHPTPENDLWWGKGFTEWTNVTAAKPVYLGHNQPNLPADLGFYDLRLDEVRQAQMDLASRFGIEGFMYYYYWFAGQKPLAAPIEKLLASDVNKPFCIMWANENWTRQWDGRSTDILLAQDYAKAELFIDDVLPFLADPRYMRIDGKPVLAVYRIGHFPDARKITDHWRARARAAGIADLYLLSVDVRGQYGGLDGDAIEVGVDGKLGFPPHNLEKHWVPPRTYTKVDKRFRGDLLSYPALVAGAIRALGTMAETAYPGVMVTFDNTARRQWGGHVWVGSNPYTFRRWLGSAVQAVAEREPDRRMVFVNAWNEWAEGAVLEPSHRFGATYLLAVRDAVYG